MIFKKGVKVAGIQPEIMCALMVAERVYFERGRPEGVTVTAVTDGKHMTGSKHYIGQAVDLRTFYFSVDVQHSIVTDLKIRLTDEFDVVLEKDHLHLEYDPK